MCGRYVIYSDSEYEELQNIVSDTEKNLSCKSGEIYPTDKAPVIINNRLTSLNWGFYTYDSMLIINARSETVDSKPMFKTAFVKRRCLIPANSYFEWKKEHDTKIKYEIGLTKKSLFFMAGLYSVFSDKKNNRYIGFVIITTQANDNLSHIHTRMPVIIEPGYQKTWLDNTTNDSSILKNILKPYNSNMTTFKISS
ncbi:UNVERIFIED_CONTAM: putative SOS response-associated peptidase YedK [Acetivibrio alkalicellulosi]